MTFGLSHSVSRFQVIGNSLDGHLPAGADGGNYLPSPGTENITYAKTTSQGRATCQQWQRQIM